MLGWGRPFGAQTGARPKEGRQPDTARLGRKQTSCARQKRSDLGRWRKVPGFTLGPLLSAG